MGSPGQRQGWWAGTPRSSSFFPVLVPATWAAMSYPDISAVILDASFDDLVPLALKVMPDSWSECSSQAALPGKGWAGTGRFVTGDGSFSVGGEWVALLLRSRRTPLSGVLNSGDLCVGQGLCLCRPFTFIPL